MQIFIAGSCKFSSRIAATRFFQIPLAILKRHLNIDGLPRHWNRKSDFGIIFSARNLLYLISSNSLETFYELVNLSHFVQFLVSFALELENIALNHICVALHNWTRDTSEECQYSNLWVEFVLILRLSASLKYSVPLAIFNVLKLSDQKETFLYLTISAHKNVCRFHDLVAQ